MSTRSFRFWHRWLIVFSVTCIAVALVLAISAGTRSELSDSAILSPFFDTRRLPSGVAPYTAFTLRVIAGTLAGWAVCLLGIALGPFARREPWAWYTLATAYLCWFSIDTTGSAWAKVWFNVVGNCVFLAVGVAPLLATYRYFVRTGTGEHN